MGSEKEKSRVLVFGLGAIGSFYACMISDHADVYVVARSNYGAVYKDGLQLKSKRYGNKTVKFKGVYPSVDDAQINNPLHFDLIICANKAIVDRPPYLHDIIRPAVGPQTCIVIIQNGIGNEEPLVRAFPANHVVGCVTFAGCIIEKPNVVSHFNHETMAIGWASGEETRNFPDSMQLLADMLRETEFTVVSDIKSERWKKVIWNAAWNTLTTLTPLNTSELLVLPDGLQFCIRVMDKVIEIARADGATIPDSFALELISRVLATGGIYSSMKNDLTNGKEMEVEAILGNVVACGKKSRIDVSLLEGLLFPLRAIQHGIRNGMYSKI